MDKNYHYLINLILDFYHDNELSMGFDNGLFREGNSEKMVLRRLGRAAKDEAEGHLLNSRYAIYAADCIDLVEEAIKNITRNDTANALQQLHCVSNALKAYKDIKTILDNEDFYKVSDVFHSYSNHLLSLPDSASKIVEKRDIISLLKEQTKVSGVRLPRDINFTIKNRVLKVYVNIPTQNMQNDGAAFEGWILALMAWLPDKIKYVELDFAIPINLSADKYGNLQICHYNRFLYRINNFLRMYPEWFLLNKNKSEVVSEFMNWLKIESCLLNHSLHERESVILTKKMERQIESWFAFEDGKKILCNHWGIAQEKLFNQLPVGVFYKEINSKNAIFTRGAGAIDLWGISANGDTLHIIELKCGKNSGMGVISETLFYTSVLYDTCITDDNIFTFGRYKNSKDTKDMLAISNGEHKFKTLYSHILAEQYHPLFSDEVIKLIQEGLTNLGIEFDRATYNYAKKMIIK